MWADEKQTYVLTREQVRRVDRLAVERYAMPSIVLMENASLHLKRVAMEMLAAAEGPVALIACGPGNNGGDGLALARHLDNEGVAVRVVLTSDPERYSGDAATNLEIVRRMEIPVGVIDREDAGGSVPRAWEELGGAGLVVDALLGTGLDRAVREPILSVIGAINALKGAKVLAVDIPSGLDCDTGRVLGAAVKADVTVSFVAAKAGFAEGAARPYIGRVVIGDIGAPAELARRLGRVWDGPGGGGPAAC